MVEIWMLVALVGGLPSLIDASPISPPLYRFDEYERCHHPEKDEAGVYCFAKVVYEGERDVMDTPRIVVNFRRNLLDWGVCVAECQRELADIREEDRQKLFQPKFSINFTYIFPADLWDNYVDPFKARYGDLINVCINNRLKRDYDFGRLAYSEIEYCSSRETSMKTPNWLMITFYATVVTLVGLLIGSNVVDRFGRDEIKEHIIVSSFSVRRNWIRLTEQPNSDLYRDLGYIDGIRVVLCLQVMTLHCILMAAIVPSSNPDYIEEVMKNPLMIDFVAISAVPVQIFFAISGLLLTTNFLKDRERNPMLEAQYVWDKVKNRFIRIAPVYYFFLLLSIVIVDIPGMQVGTVGYIMLIQEQARCLKKWWTNVLFILNLPSFEGEVCNLQGWYLAADQQQFLFTLLLVTICWIYSKHVNSILWSSIAVAVAIPVGIVYFYELESALPVRLSEGQLLVMYMAWFRKVYLPGYSNIGSYLAGVIVGYLYHHHKHNKLDIENNSLFKIAKKARLPLLALAYLPTFLFYRYEIPRRSWLTILHTILFRNAGIITASVTFIECFLNPPGPIRKFLSSKPMTSLGKLSYSVYVLHIPVGRFILNGFAPLMESKLSNLIWVGPFFMLFYLVAFVVYFSIEQPIFHLLKYFLVDKRQGKKSIK